MVNVVLSSRCANGVGRCVVVVKNLDTRCVPNKPGSTSRASESLKIRQEKQKLRGRFVSRRTPPSVVGSLGNIRFFAGP